MYAYRVTKYDPALRNARGAFLRDDWTAMSDIGKIVGGHRIRPEDYLGVEDAYVDSAMGMLTSAGVKALKMSDLTIMPIGKWHGAIDDCVAQFCSGLREGLVVSGGDLELVVRGCLRNFVWCRLWGELGSYVHFGDDYYMYVGLHVPASHLRLPPGMFMEEMESPYMILDDIED